MKFIVIFVVTFYCLYHHVVGNQQDPNDPSKPFWPTRGRRSGGRITSIKADDDMLPAKWQEDEDGTPDLLEKDILQRREQATSLLATVLNALSSWDGEVVRKRDGKPVDPNNPFWAHRG